MPGVLAWVWASCLHGCPLQLTPQVARVNEGIMGVAGVALGSEDEDVEGAEEQAGTEVLLARPSRLHRDHTKV